MTRVNRRITLAARPLGMPKESDFKLVETPVADPGDGELLVEVHYLSVDPYMRRRMMDVPSYAPPVGLGEVMVGGAVGRVVASRHPRFQEGDFVESMNFGWQEYALSNGRGVRTVDPKLAPISTALYVLGMPGMTAYFGLLDICAPQAGETVLVSGAAGAVGLLVGQIAKIRGCRAVGIAGGDDKIAYMVQEAGFDAGYNYKTVTDHAAKLRALCPQGIDVYFDNVGGVITDAVIPQLNPLARVSLCGQISSYNATTPELGPRFLTHLVIKQIKMQGFLVFQFQQRMQEGMQQMAQWLREGKLVYRESVVRGVENAPRAFIGMLRGENIGKQLVKFAAAQ
ncbi:MAG: NADP-dependent oxidoreductase [Candidatus Lambdaproteobacteria bacterium]|nr:NADP-dependent oxidoreductase [Candidatus Lambdaproteobacteria bacterium]